jgi:hypothetical protein
MAQVYVARRHGWIWPVAKLWMLAVVAAGAGLAVLAPLLGAASALVVAAAVPAGVSLSGST